MLRGWTLVQNALDQAHQFRRSHRRIFLACLQDEDQDLVGQLVRLLGAALVGNQAGETTLLEGGLRLIERGREKPKVVAAPVTEWPSLCTRRSISYLTWTRSLGSKSCPWQTAGR